MFSLILCYIVDYTYFPKSQMIVINHEINCLLKKLNFSVFWRQRQSFLWGLISQLFVYGSFTLMAHFEAYISHMDMENFNGTHSLLKKLARTFQTSLIEIYGIFFCQNHAFLDILTHFSQIIQLFTPKCYTLLERYDHEDS